MGMKNGFGVAGEVYRRDMDHVMDVEAAHVDLDRVGNLQRQTFDLDLAHQRLQDAALGDAGRLTDEAQGYLDSDRLREIDLVEIGVDEGPTDRRAVNFLGHDGAVR